MTHDVRRKYCFFPFFKLDNIIFFFAGQIYNFLVKKNTDIKAYQKIKKNIV